MDLQTFWSVLNSNVGTMLLGSGLGWIFLNFIWDPWNRRRNSALRQAVFRGEAEFRISTLEEEIGVVPTSFRIDGGTYARSLDPAYQSWSLYGLIFAGWGKATYDTALPLVNAIKLDAEIDRNNPDKVKGALVELQKLKSLLGLCTAAG